MEYLITTPTEQYTMKFNGIIHAYHYCLSRHKFEDFLIESYGTENISGTSGVVQTQEHLGV